MSNSGPQTKFGPRCNYIWPARQFKITACRLRIQNDVLYNIKLFLLHIQVEVKLVWVHMKRCECHEDGAEEGQRVQGGVQTALVNKGVEPSGGSSGFTSLSTF